MSYFNKLFGLYSDDEKKFLYFLGKKLFSSNNKNSFYTKQSYEKLKEELIFINRKLIATAFLHQKTFPQFKNINQGKTVVLIGAGPTLNKFQPIENAIYVGLNRTFLYNKVNFDYLFAIDSAGICFYYDEFKKYVEENNHCKFFIGNQDWGKNFQIPESYILSLKQDNIYRYNTTSKMGNKTFAFDLSSEPLGNFCTISLQAMQFILYTNPQKIYLVGIDCNIASAGHFSGEKYNVNTRNENAVTNDNNSIQDWHSFKDFKNIYYPDTEIISVNPVGLKGLFTDIYTE